MCVCVCVCVCVCMCVCVYVCVQARMLMCNSVLTDVELADNSFSNSAAAIFTEMLYGNTTLLSLDLRCGAVCCSVLQCVAVCCSVLQ